MAALLPRNANYICRSCRAAKLSTSFPRSYATIAERPPSLRQQIEKRNAASTQTSELPSSAASYSAKRPTGLNSASVHERIQPSRRNNARIPKFEPQETEQISPVPIDTSNPKGALKKIEHDALQILDSDRIPDNLRVMEVMDQAYQFSNLIIFGQTEAPEEEEVMQQQQTSQSSRSESSLLSDLDEPQQTTKRRMTRAIPVGTPELSISYREKAAASLCEVVYTLLEDPKVFITTAILSAYVRIICLLGRPEYLPKIFYLYANKSIPKPNSYPIKYSDPYSRSPKYAVPRPLADAALEAAILRKDMPLCISIIDTTVATESYRYGKLIRKGLLPLGTAAMTVPIAYAAADWASKTQLAWESDMFFWMCMSGATAYLGTMGTLIWITVSTWNDHHKRVRWVPGTPLGRRWMREDEREFFDRIAQAWGFQDEFKHGEETGEEWEALRETLALRYMELDRSSLLPGML